MSELPARIWRLATREVSAVEDDPYRELTLIGLVGMQDPPRAGVRDVVAACDPVFCEVSGEFAPRGGVYTTITARHD